jgi:hypothetical protein
MKGIFLCFIVLIVYGYAAAQEHIDGLWYSGDSTRIYRITANGSGYGATLLSSKRKEDKTGALVLSHLTFNQRKNFYNGLAHALDDGMAVQVKIRRMADGKTLQLKLRRMFIFPLYIKWYKAD